MYYDSENSMHDYEYNDAEEDDASQDQMIVIDDSNYIFLAADSEELPPTTPVLLRTSPHRGNWGDVSAAAVDQDQDLDNEDLGYDDYETEEYITW